MNRTIESILVPTDGSEGAWAGARRGIDLAATLGADLYVLSVLDTREIGPPLSTIDTDDRTERERLLEEEAERMVDTVAGSALSQVSGRVTTAVERGIPFRTINEYVDTRDIDLIVMGTHGRTGLERVLLGSVAEKTLRTADVPVVTVSPSADIGEVGDVTYDDILLPTDGSDAAELAIEWGITLAEVYDATIHTVYSVDTSRFARTEGTGEIYDALERSGRNALATVREHARAADIGIAGNVGSGPAARTILSYIEDHGIDLVVMGTHGRSGVQRYLIGSVTETVVRNADVPVCCVPMR